MINTIRDDGVVKYRAVHTEGEIPHDPLLMQLDAYRTELFDLGLVGVYSDGIGFGNVSIKHRDGCIISGTSTGGLRILGATGYCFIHSFNLAINEVFTQGPVKASSEAMTHCAIYQANPLIQSVLHIHSHHLWIELMRKGCMSTPADIAYGTPQMALSIASLVNTTALSNGLIVMSGHEDGIVAFGESISLAFEQIYAVLDV